MPWSFFGTSSIEKIPEDQLLIETLTQHTGCAAGGDISQIWNQGAYKTVCRPEFVQEIYSPHYCQYIQGRKHGMTTYDLLHINHYWSRDEYYLKNYKIPCRESWGQSSASVMNWAIGMNGSRENNPILRFIPELKKRIALKK